MTESEWLSSRDPAAMLNFVVRNGRLDDGPNCPRFGTDRKLRLFACATEPVFIAWQRLDARGEIDWPGTARQLVASYQTTTPTSCPKDRCAALLRDIFGNVFRPVTFEHDWRAWHWTQTCNRCGVQRRSGEMETIHGKMQGCKPSWLTPTVLQIAAAIYEERAWDRMPVLADALEEAGCREESVLRHCRGEEDCSFSEKCNACEGDGIAAGSSTYEGRPCRRCDGKGTLTFKCVRKLRGPHVRGCWCLDILMNK